MKGTLIEIKNNLQGNNRVDEAEHEINDLEQKEAKNNQSEQEDEKRITKMRKVKAASGTTSRGPTFASQGYRRRRERARNWKFI